MFKIIITIDEYERLMKLYNKIDIAESTRQKLIDGLNKDAGRGYILQESPLKSL